VKSFTPTATSFTVALIGPDGVGKTTIARHLESRSKLPIKYLYMGENPQASNVTLPTMRWWKGRKYRLAKARAAKEATGRGDSGTPTEPPGAEASVHGARRSLPKTLWRPIRKSAGLVHRVAEEAYRQRFATSLARLGFIVLYDRHFLLDRWHTDLRGSSRRPLKRRLHGFFLRRVLRAPDLVICLDAPGEVVWRRKGDLTPELLELKRAQYRELAVHVAHFELIDADRPLEQVFCDVEDRIQRFHSEIHHARN